MRPNNGKTIATTLWYLWQRGKLSQFYNNMNEIEQRRPLAFMQNAICSLFYLIYWKKLNSPLDFVSYNFLFVQVANENKSNLQQTLKNGKHHGKRERETGPCLKNLLIFQYKQLTTRIKNSSSPHNHLITQKYWQKIPTDVICIIPFYSTFFADEIYHKEWILKGDANNDC